MIMSDDLTPYITEKMFVRMPNGCRRWVSVRNGRAKFAWKPVGEKQRDYHGKLVRKGSGYEFKFDRDADLRTFLEEHVVLRTTYADRSKEAIAKRRRAYLEAYYARRRELV
jgi:hypothetical protein